VYDFYQNVLKDDRYFYAFEAIEGLRQQLLTSQEQIEVTDFGVGSKMNKSNTRTIGQIANTASIPKSKGELLFKIVDHYKPGMIVELGTSLGLSTLYLSLSDTHNKVLTFEGCNHLSSLAIKHFNSFNLKNIEIVSGKIQETLLLRLNDIEKIDLLFMDAHHAFEPSIAFFETCLTKLNQNSCVVMDDIYWSKGMFRAWEHIRQYPEVSVSIDLFHLGILFMKKNQAKEHFILR